MDKVKWGFIGCGNVTEKKSGPAFNKVEGSSIEAVMCRNKDRAKDYSSRHNIRKWYIDAHELIHDPEVNAIYIATPPSSHATYAIMAMKAGKPVYIEKPMASSYEECTRINRVSEETGVKCFVAYYRRYLPYFIKVKELVESEIMGEIVNIQLSLLKPPYKEDLNKDNLPWRVKPEIAGAGYFYDLASHQLDILQDIFGCILEAEGMTNNMGGLYPAEDNVSACFKFESDLVGAGSWSFLSIETAQEDKIRIVGTKGSLQFATFSFEPIVLITDKGQEEFILENPEHIQQYLIQAVVEDLQGKSKCSCTGLSATTTNWVMDKILGKL